MSFKFNLSVFKSTKPDSKIDFSGMMNIKVEELDALCRFVMSQAPDQYGAVQVPITGWKKQAKSGLNYISAVCQPPRDWVDPGAGASVDKAAQSLATATDGVVVDFNPQDDLF